MTSNPILAVVKNIAVHEQQSVEWAKYSIGAKRVDTMHEAIIKLKNGERFFFVVINEDCIPDFMKQLPVLRDVCVFPIIVVTSTFSMEKKLAAMRSGADFYVPFSEKIEYDIHATFQVFEKQSKWANREYLPPVLISGDIILSPSLRSVLVKGTPASLTNQEFDLLFYFMSNRGQALSFKNIYLNVWQAEYKESYNGAVKTAIKKLRKKIANDENENSVIENIRGYGYKMPM